MVLCLGEPPVRLLCCWLLLFFIHCCSSFIFVLHLLLFFIFRLLYHATGTPTWFLRLVKASTSSELYLGYFRLPLLFIFRERYGFQWAFFTHRRFLPYAPFPTFLTQPAFNKASLGAGSSSLKFVGLHADPQNTHPAHLFI